MLIIISILLVVLNGFFVAAEFSLVKLRQTRVEAMVRDLGWRGRILARVHHDLDAYLSACQLGITLASLGLGWVGEPAFAAMLRPLFSTIGLGSDALIHGIAFFCAFFVISYLHIVIGELAPKTMAIRIPDRVALWTAVPLYAFYWIMYPAIYVLNHSAAYVLGLLRLDLHHGNDSHYSAEELKLILRTSDMDTHHTHDEWNTLAKALDFGTMEVAELMRPFNEVTALSAECPLEAHLATISQHRYSRYPWVDAQHKVSGVIHLKDVFLAMNAHQLPASLGELARDIQTIPPDMPAIVLFRKFREGAPHFAVVAYPDGDPIGYVTLDDMLGALVGEISDEFRQNNNHWTRLPDGALRGKGSLPLFTLERELGKEIERHDAESVGGLIMQQIDGLPAQGQTVAFEHFDAVVESMHGTRINQVRIYPRNPA